MARNRIKKRRKPQRSMTLPEIDWRLVIKVGSAAGVMAAAYLGTLWVMDQPIDTVRVIGKFERVSAVQVEAALEPYLTAGFLSVDLRLLRHRLNDLPWISNAQVRRKWPAFLEVTVEEEEAAACWGEDGLLNMSGELFVEHATHVPVELPRLSGPTGTERLVARRYFEIQSRLEQRGLSARSLSLTQRGAWDLRLSNGIGVRLGAAAIDERIAKFFRVLDTVVAPRDRQVQYIDMRYTNGFAIGWKEAGSMPASIVQEARPNA